MIDDQSSIQSLMVSGLQWRRNSELEVPERTLWYHVLEFCNALPNSCPNHDGSGVSAERPDCGDESAGVPVFCSIFGHYFVKLPY